MIRHGTTLKKKLNYYINPVKKGKIVYFLAGVKTDLSTHYEVSHGYRCKLIRGQLPVQVTETEIRQRWLHRHL